MIWGRTQRLVRGCFAVCRINSLSFDYLGDELSNIVNNRYGFIDYEYGIASASTDFVSTSVASASGLEMNGFWVALQGHVTYGKLKFWSSSFCDSFTASSGRSSRTAPGILYVVTFSSPWCHLISSPSNTNN